MKRCGGVPRSEVLQVSVPTGLMRHSGCTRVGFIPRTADTAAVPLTSLSTSTALRGSASIYLLCQR